MMTSPAPDYSCTVCGAHPDDPVPCGDDGDIVPGSPERWVFCYRGDRPFGICDQCFQRGRRDRFTAEEWEWLGGQFALPADDAAGD